MRQLLTLLLSSRNLLIPSDRLLPKFSFNRLLSTMATRSDLVFKCGCGKVQVPLQGEPYLEGDCVCRSCVAAVKYIDEKKGTDKSISCLSKDGTGMAISGYKLNQFELPPDLDVGFVKVGEDGDKTRVYTKCCGTFTIHGGGHGWPFAMRMFNRNALYHKASGDQYVSPDEPCVNFNAAHSFDPSAIPEPKADGAPDHFVPKFQAMANPDFDVEPYKQNPILFPDMAKAEVVPVTWEK